MILDKTIKIRVSSAELERWKIVANYDGYELSAWIREMCKGSCDSYDEMPEEDKIITRDDAKSVPTKPFVPTNDINSVPTKETSVPTTQVPVPTEKRSILTETNQPSIVRKIRPEIQGVKTWAQLEAERLSNAKSG